MRNHSYPFTAEDRKIVSTWRRKMLIGCVALAIVGLLGSVVFRADQAGRDRAANESASVQIDHFGVDDIVRSLIGGPEDQPGAVAAQRTTTPLKGAGLDPKHRR